MEERYQKELFEEYRPKRHFPKNENIVPKTKFSLTLSLEKTVFSSIAIVMVMVVVYAFGVERGKAVQRGAPLAPAAKTIKSVTVGGERAVNAPVQPVAVARPAPAPQAQTAAQAAPLSQQLKPYTIVGATFTRKEWADKEVERIKKSGYDATVYQSSNFFLVCIGSYQTKDEAKLALSKIRSSYKDAYLRSR